MRKPTGPDGQPPAGTDGPEPAVPYDAAEWDRRLLAARERRAQILALRGAGGQPGAASVPIPVPPVAGLFAEAQPPASAAAPSPPSRVTPRPAEPAGPGFEGRMDRIARAVEAARQRALETDPAPAAAPVSAPASPAAPAARSAPAGRPAAEPLRRAVARAPAAVRAQPEPAAAPTRPRLVPAVALGALGAVAAIGLAVGGYLMFGRDTVPGADVVALVAPGATDAAIAGPQPGAGLAPDRPSAHVLDAAPGALPALEIAAIPAPPALPLDRDVPAAPLPSDVVDAAAVSTSEPAVPVRPQPAPRPGEESAALADGATPAPADADPAGAVALADPAVVPPAVEPVVPDPAAFRLRVNAPASVPAAEVEAVGTVLAGAGFPGVQPQRVGFTVSRTHLRFYNAEDAAAAQAIAARLGAEARDFTGYRPKPAAGTIEVWIAGAAPDGASPSGRAAPAQSGGLPSPAEAAKNIGQAVKTLVETFPANEQR